MAASPTFSAITGVVYILASFVLDAVGLSDAWLPVSWHGRLKTHKEHE
jgi:hypothetical protein